MSKNISGLTTSHTASGAIPARRLVKFGTTDALVALAVLAADAAIGVSTNIPADDGQSCDAFRNGIAPVEYGGNVTRGQPLTADAQGRAVAAAPAAGANVRIAGFAEVSGVLGDIGSVFLAPSVMQGA